MTDDKLTIKQKKFANLYVSEEFFGNGFQSYMAVYDVDQKKKGWKNTAMAAASRLLSNVKVLKYINEQLDKAGLNDSFVDKQLLFLINQHIDFKAKLGAIKEYNSLKSRIIKKIDHTTKGKSINKPSIVIGK